MSVADRQLSSKTCHACRHVQDRRDSNNATAVPITHQRDDNAASTSHATRNHPGVVGPVGAVVKRGADCKTGLARRAAVKRGKATGHPAGRQPETGLQVK